MKVTKVISCYLHYIFSQFRPRELTKNIQKNKRLRDLARLSELINLGG